jgi:hypothetical protein
LERFRDEEDNAVCLYSLPGGNGLLGGWERTRVEDLWSWPWLWSKAKVRVRVRVREESNDGLWSVDG